MSNLGISLRLARLADSAASYLLVPMDHPVSAGPLPGLVDPVETTRALVAGGATGVIVHKGLVRRVEPVIRGSRTGLVVHASASTNKGELGDEKVSVARVEEAIALGADAFSVHVNLGAATEDRMLADLGDLTCQCHRLGLPILAMVYLRGPRIKNPFEADGIAHAARLAEELGVDLVKVAWTGSIASFSRVTEAVAIPVLIAGGAKMDAPEDFLRVAWDAKQAGAQGVSVGRNIWQAKDPRRMLGALRAIFSDGLTVDRAIGLL